MTDLADRSTPGDNMVDTKVGKIDLNNVSGRKKLELIKSGKVSMNAFTAPDNMPGRKLAELRARASGAINEALEKEKKNTINSYKIGDMVEFKKWVTKVVDVHEKKGVKIHKREGGTSKWIHHTKVKPVNPDEEE